MTDKIEAIRKELETVVLSPEARKILNVGLNMVASLSLEINNGPFICGIGGEKDSMGLSEFVSICPTYGAAGSAFYKKHSEYSEPGY